MKNDLNAKAKQGLNCTFNGIVNKANPKANQGLNCTFNGAVNKTNTSRFYGFFHGQDSQSKGDYQALTERGRV
ncbi:MAG: hypothetical protein RRX95_05625 [Oscillospiraceae bacterium]